MARCGMTYGLMRACCIFMLSRPSKSRRGIAFDVEGALQLESRSFCDGEYWGSREVKPSRSDKLKSKLGIKTREEKRWEQAADLLRKRFVFIGYLENTEFEKWVNEYIATARLLSPNSIDIDPWIARQRKLFQIDSELEYAVYMTKGHDKTGKFESEVWELEQKRKKFVCYDEHIASLDLELAQRIHQVVKEKRRNAATESTSESHKAEKVDAKIKYTCHAVCTAKKCIAPRCQEMKSKLKKCKAVTRACTSADFDKTGGSK